MSESNVFMTDMRAKPGRSLTHKFVALVEKAGFKEMDLARKYVAIKMHFGEPGNLAFIRPNYAARLARMVSKAGGVPFLTDANTLYSGGRGNAVDHLASAAQNGFTRVVVGCDVIIADGLRGTEYREIEIGQKHFRSAKIASAVADADVLITLSHFKGHELAGFGGAIKNLGMGCGSRGGKLEMHSASKPRILEKNCTSCGMCVKSCPQEAITLTPDHKVASIDYDKCIGCGQCIAMCQYDAAQAVWNESAENATEKIAEYALAVVKDRPCLHVNFITDVAPLCDCYGYNDAAMVSDMGIAASSDPVALDRACADLVNDAPLSPGTRLEGMGLAPGDDKFGAANPNTSWQAGLAYAESIGLGSQSYRLQHVE
jgi:uncharacterized Fe-S center protein